MDLVSDLKDSIRTVLEDWGFTYDKKSDDPRKLATQYFYAAYRMIPPVSRSVHLSAEIRDSLRKLSDRRTRLVDVIKRRFEKGESVSRFLSEEAQNTFYNDRIFNDYGIHHFHLEDKVHKRKPHLVARSDYLLFAMVTESDVYFVDVARHPRNAVADDYGWVRQELLQIIHTNWPNLLKPFEMHGVKGTVITDAQKKELRRKNTNLTSQVGDVAVFSPGGGVMSDGTNAKCKFLGMKLIHEVEVCQEYLANQPEEIRKALRKEGKSVTGAMKFKLAHVTLLRVPTELTSQLYAPHGNLGGSGFAIVETTTDTLVQLTFE